MDMREKLFETQSYGKAALVKFGPVHENFRIYCCGYVDEERTVMRCDGVLFREATRGINKGKLTVKVPGTTRNVFVHVDEMAKFREE